MNDIQCKAMAAGFVHALKESSDLRDRWVEIRKSEDWVSLRLLIGQTLGTAKEPTEEDLKTMREHCSKRLGSEISELQQIDTRIEAGYVYNGMPHGGGGGKQGG